MMDYALIIKWTDSAGRKKIFYELFETAFDAENARDTYAVLLNKMMQYGTIQTYDIDVR